MGYREEKATQAAAELLKLSGEKMYYMKLLKLLYLIDRKALLSWGRPVTYDRYVSMDHGPNLSITYNLINESVEPGKKSYWLEHISEKESYQVSLIADPGTEELSEAEIKLIHRIYSHYGKFDRWQLRDLTHHLPEWKDPKGSSIPIEYRDILLGGGKTQLEAKIIEDEIKSTSMCKEMFA